jgi:hypothetical protein
VLTALWSGLGGELAKQWAARLLTPAFAFWSGGLAALWWHAHSAGVHAHGWTAELTATARPWQAFPVIGQVVLVLGALALLAASALLAERLTTPVLRILEGYWSRPQWLWRLLVTAHGKPRERWAARVRPLAVRQRRGTLSVAEHQELRTLLRQSSTPNSATVDLDRLADLQLRQQAGFRPDEQARLTRGRQVLHRIPEQPSLRMPSRLGNVLRAAERRPTERYGLDTSVCWIALWLVLPEQTRTELAQARAAVDSATRTWLWAGLFLVWTPWTWWALVVGLVIPPVVYQVSLLPAAAAFGALIVAAFDLNRMALYDALLVSRPAGPEEERQTTAPLVNNMLWGGVDRPGLTFTVPAG